MPRESPNSGASSTSTSSTRCGGSSAPESCEPWKDRTDVARSQQWKEDDVEDLDWHESSYEWRNRRLEKKRQTVDATVNPDGAFLLQEKGKAKVRAGEAAPRCRSSLGCAAVSASPRVRAR